MVGGDGCGGGLVDVVLFCCVYNFEEDLRWEPKLGVFVDLVELDDAANDAGVTLFNTVQALRGAFCFSTSVELKTKDAGGGGAGREMIDSNTSLLSILTPEHFFAVSAICCERSDFCLYLLFRQVLGTKLWLSNLCYHVCDQV